AAFLAFAFHRPILTLFGEWLIAQDPLVKSDAALVLSGEDSDGKRTRKAVQLYHQGMVRKVALSGAMGSFNHYETDFSEPLARVLGVPPGDLIVLPHKGRSTLEEARETVPPLSKAGIHSIIVVTSSYHTRRARRYFQRVARAYQISVSAAPAESDWFRPDAW